MKIKLRKKYLSAGGIVKAVGLFVALATVGVAGGFYKSSKDAGAAAQNFSLSKSSFYAYSPNSGVALYVPTLSSGSINGWCLNPNLEYPRGHSYNETNSHPAINDPGMLGTLKYGYGGDDNSLQQKHGLSDDEARWATGVAIWRNGYRLGLKGYVGDFVGMRYTTNRSNVIQAYIDELMTKKVNNDSNAGNALVLIQSATGDPVEDNGKKSIEFSVYTNAYVPVVTTTTNEATLTRISESGSLTRYRLEVPLSFSGNVEVRAAASRMKPGAARARVFTPASAGYQDIITYGGSTAPEVSVDDDTRLFAFNKSTIDANLKIIKKDDMGRLVPGVVFEISKTADFVSETETTTAADGTSTINYTGLDINDNVRYVREKSVPDHLVLNTAIKKVNLVPNATASVEFINAIKFVGYGIKKVDEDGGNVPGVVFEVAEDQNFTKGVKELTTGETGWVFSSDKVTVGTLYVREKTVPNHLVKSDEIKTINLGNDSILARLIQFTNNFKKSSIEIVKVDTKQNPVAGVVFEVSTSATFASGNETVTTNADGVAALTTSYKIGQVLYVREKSVPAHLVLSTEVKNVTVAENTVARVSFVNDFKTVNYEVVKTDEEGRSVPGVVFEVSTSRDFSTGVKTITTNTSGIATGSQKLSEDTIYIREKSVPVHLVKSTEVKELRLTANGVARVTFVNKLKTYDVKLSKSDLSSAEPIEGVTLTIYKADDKNNTKKIYESVTDKNGELKGLKLTRGKYKFIETHATIGYKINPNPHFFEVMDDGTIVGSTVMTDEREEYEFVVDKVDDKGNKVSGVVFSAKNKLTGEVQKATTDKDGVAKFKGIWAEYEIREEETLANLIKDDKVYVLKVNADGSYEKLKVVNKVVEVEAPKTGFEKSGNFTGYVIAAVAVVFGGVMAFAISKKK